MCSSSCYLSPQPWLWCCISVVTHNFFYYFIFICELQLAQATVGCGHKEICGAQLHNRWYTCCGIAALAQPMLLICITTSGTPVVTQVVMQSQLVTCFNPQQHPHLILFCNRRLQLQCSITTYGCDGAQKNNMQLCTTTSSCGAE